MFARTLALLAIAMPTHFAPQGRVVVVRATEFKFDAPASVPAGTLTFRLENHGLEVHHLWIVRLTHGKTSSDFTKMMDAWGTGPKMPDWAIDVGGPNNVAPGLAADATMTLEPGTYMLLCYVPSADGTPHAMKGMIRPLTVTAKGATKPREPTADVSITLVDFGFEISPAITAGRHTLRFEDKAPQTHEAILARLLPGHTLQEALAWYDNGQLGPTPVVTLGGASGLANGRHMYMTTDFVPGMYVLLCVMPDATDGRAHSDHGMVAQFTVAPTR